MKVLLTQDVENLGHAGDVKTVADGYGRNFLLPRAMAVIASAGAVKAADRVKTASVARRAKDKADVDAIAQMIGGTTVHFTARAGEKGKMFGSITAQHIADALGKQLGREIDKRKVGLREPLRELGTHTISVRLGADAIPNITVVITPEGMVSASGAQAAIANAAVADAAAS